MGAVGRKKEAEWHHIQKSDIKMSNIIFLPLSMAQFVSMSVFLTVSGYGIFNCEIARASLVAV